MSCLKIKKLSTFEIIDTLKYQANKKIVNDFTYSALEELQKRFYSKKVIKNFLKLKRKNKEQLK